MIIQNFRQILNNYSAPYLLKKDVVLYYEGRKLSTLEVSSAVIFKNE